MNEQAMLLHIEEESRVIEEILENKDFYTKELVNHFMQHNVKRIYISGHDLPIMSDAYYAL